MFISKGIKALVLVVLVLALSGATYAFAASNTVPATKAGDGNGAISGYTVSNIKYNLDGTTPTTIATVTFTLNDAATTVRIKLVAAGTTWYNCTNTTGNDWSCIAGAPVLTADNLQVVAAN